MITTIQKCRICGNPHLDHVIDLRPQWIQGFFNYPNKSKPSQRLITTKVVRCNPEKFEGGCGLVQNLVTVDPRILYSNYGYSSSISQTMRNHLKNIVNKVLELNPDPKCVLDIGGNTGELIKNYTNATTKIVIDPSDVAKEALQDNKDDIKLINECYPLPERLCNKYDVIHSIACLYDIHDLHYFLSDVKKNLIDTGIYVFEVAYLPSVLKNCAYDGMVLEHISLFSLDVLDKLFKDNDLKIFKAEETDTNGGSILCFATHKKCNKYNQYLNSVNEILLKEFDLALDTPAPYDAFEDRVLDNGYKLRNKLNEMKEAGERIYIYGSSTKLNVILQRWGIEQNYITAAAERDPRKIGGSILNGIPIISEEEARENATVFLVGPYHFKNEILLREVDTLKMGVKFLFPLPDVEVVEYKNNE